MKLIGERYKTIRDNKLRGAFVTDEKGFIYPKPYVTQEEDGIEFISIPTITEDGGRFCGAAIKSPSQIMSSINLYSRWTVIMENFILKPTKKFPHQSNADGNGFNAHKDNIVFVSRASQVNWYNKNLKDELKNVKKGDDGLPVDWDGLSEDVFNFFKDVQEWKMEMRSLVNRSIASNHEKREKVREDAENQDKLLGLSNLDIALIKDAFYDDKKSINHIAGILKVSTSVIRDILLEDEQAFFTEVKKRSKSFKNNRRAQYEDVESKDFD